MLNNIWNGKLKGVFSAIILLISAISSRVSSKTTTFLFINNINKSGRKIKVMKGLKYRYPKYIEVGSNVIIGKETTLTSENIETHHLLLEEGVSIGEHCTIDFSGGVIIRRYAHIAHNVLILTHDHGYDYRNTPSGKYLEIGENAFIGSNSIILHNVRLIGKKAVIGSGSVVTKEVPDYAIVAGNPARIINYVDHI